MRWINLPTCFFPFEAEREETRTTALSFGLRLRKTAWVKSGSLMVWTAYYGKECGMAS
jgi:hypothetical protein